MDNDNNKLPVLLRSSANPEKLSMTIKGVLTGIVTVLSFTGVIPADAVAQIGPFADMLVTVVQGGLVLLTGIWTLYGLGRKIVKVWFS